MHLLAQDGTSAEGRLFPCLQKYPTKPRSVRLSVVTCEAPALLTSPSSYLHKVKTLRSKTQETKKPGRTRPENGRNARSEGWNAKGSWDAQHRASKHPLRTILESLSQGAASAAEGACAPGTSPPSRWRMRVRDPAGQRRRPGGGSRGCCGSASCARGLSLLRRRPRL